MPLFFFISGYLLSSNRLRLESWNGWLWRSGKTLFLPWLVFYVLSWGYQLMASIVRQDSLKGLLDMTPIRGFISGTSESMTVNLVLWFFPALLLTSASFRLLYRAIGTKGTLIITTLLALIWLYGSSILKSRWLWSADCVPIALFFYSWGFTIARYGDRIVLLFKQHTHPLWGGAWLSGLFFLVMLNGRVDLNGLSWGEHPLLYLPTAFWGIGGLLWLATQTTRFNYTNWLSQNSLIIFPLHPLLFGGITGFGMKILNLPTDFQYTNPAIGMIYVILALMLAYPAASLLRPLLIR